MAADIEAGGEPSGVIHPRYLPYSEEVLNRHFAPLGTGEERDHVAYYRDQAQHLADYEAAPVLGGRETRRVTRAARQIEKDERFWVVSALLGLFYSSDPAQRFARALSMAFDSERPPLSQFSSWEECLRGKLHLYFEVGLPSPPSYRRWLKDHLSERQLIPYVIEAAEGAGELLEGRTHVDALLLAEETRFAVLFEGKVVSDADSKVFFDLLRNQVIRNIDVMLDVNSRLVHPLNRRDPTKTCFALLTPRLFKEHPKSRLFGWLYNDYRENLEALQRDLPHRLEDPDQDLDWEALTRRIGWLTFEGCNEIEPGVCPWFDGGR